ncbi:MAG: TlpA disulfide reductase family protein [Bacteroidia bacterium]|nr:TlpA disulfide reductase family protein [Bacteroidia bacterium]
MRISFLHPSFLLSCLLVAQIGGLRGQTVRIMAEWTACDRDTLFLFELDGATLRPAAALALQPTAAGRGFDIQVQGVPEGFYLIGTGKQEETRMLVLGNEPQIQITGAHCRQLPQSMVYSGTNAAVDLMLRKTDAHANSFNALMNQYRVSLQRQQGIENVEADMARLDQARMFLLDSLRQAAPFVAKVAALRTYLSYPNAGGEWADEAQYFAGGYFRFADLRDPAYDRIPQLQDAVRNWASTLPRLGLPHETQVAYAEALLQTLPQGSRAQKSAILGLIGGFRGANEDAFATYATRYQQAWPGDNPQIADQLTREVAAVQHRLIGSIAPDIRLPSPKGDTLSLHSLRGQYVLIDFWASWCGPCRKENPNVVRMYQGYHTKGFEILGVSLDSDASRWTAAIAQDRLTWPHVSDLKQWRSAPAQRFGVSSIPATILLDKEGRIIAKNLRGAELERKLAELLGPPIP